MENSEVKFKIPKSPGQLLLVFFIVVMIGATVILSFVKNSAGTPAVTIATLLFGISALWLLWRFFLSRSILVTNEDIRIKYSFLFWNNKTYPLADCIGYFLDRLSWNSKYGHGWVPIVFIGFKNGNILKLKEIGDGADYKSRKINSVVQILKSHNIQNLNSDVGDGIDEKGYAKRSISGELKLTKEVAEIFKKQSGST